MLPVSVVIPAYNRAALLRDALASVAAQTVRAAEVVVVDDGSTDGTGDAARELGARVIRVENGGVSAARNVGIDAASQPWIAFLDSDDLWLPDKLERQWRAVERSPELGFIFTDLAWFGEGPVPNEAGLDAEPVFRALRPRADDDDVVRFAPAALAGALARTNFCQMSTLLMRTDAARRVRFNETMRYAEDHDFVLRSLTMLVPALVRRKLVRYRFHGASASRNELSLYAGALAFVDLAARRREAYPPGVPERLTASAPLLHRRLGAAFLRDGQLGPARHHLRRAARRRPDLRALAALGFASLPPALTGVSGR